MFSSCWFNGLMLTGVLVHIVTIIYPAFIFSSWEILGYYIPHIHSFLSFIWHGIKTKSYRPVRDCKTRSILQHENQGKMIADRIRLIGIKVPAPFLLNKAKTGHISYTFIEGRLNHLRHCCSSASNFLHVCHFLVIPQHFVLIQVICHVRHYKAVMSAVENRIPFQTDHIHPCHSA